MILFDPIFQGLALSLMAGEVASTVLSRMAVPVLYYVSKKGHAAASDRLAMSPVPCRLAVLGRMASEVQGRDPSTLAKTLEANFLWHARRMFPASRQIAQDARISELPTTIRRAKKPDSQISNHAHFAEYWISRHNEEVNGRSTITQAERK